MGVNNVEKFILIINEIQITTMYYNFMHIGVAKTSFDNIKGWAEYPKIIPCCQECQLRIFQKAIEFH